MEAGLEDVRRRLSRVGRVVENTDLDVADASDHPRATDFWGAVGYDLDAGMAR